MNADDSIVLREFSRRYNNVLIESNFQTRPDPIDIENDIVADQDIIPGHMLDDLSVRLPGISKIRLRASKEVGREIAHVWAAAFANLERCLALADHINTRFVQTIFNTGSDVLKAKVPRPDPISLSGAYLKCVLLLSLYGKSCCIATEISCLLKAGFPDGAMSRLRTLHEHLVILMLLNNDETYELSERYQDHAVFEQLKLLRAEKRSYEDPIWAKPKDYDKKIAVEISELVALAAGARSKWGPEIEDQYGWARPALPRAKRGNRRIYLSDLEQSVGMNFLRGNYMAGNDRIHAGPSSVVSYLDFDSVGISHVRPRRDDETIAFVGYRTAKFIGWATRAAGQPISWETEEYDEFLYVCEMERITNAAMEEFRKIGSSL